MVAMNTSSASTFLRAEVGGAITADMCFLQELAVGEDGAQGLSEALRARGWVAAVAAAVRASQGGMSSGTAVLLRPHLEEVQGFGHRSADGRICAAAVHTKRLGTIRMLSYYAPSAATRAQRVDSLRLLLEVVDNPPMP